MRQNHQIRGLHSIIRDVNTTRADFIFYSGLCYFKIIIKTFKSDRLIRLVIEEGLGFLPFEETNVLTPTGNAE